MQDRSIQLTHKRNLLGNHSGTPPTVKRVLSPQHQIELELSRSTQAIMRLCCATWWALYRIGSYGGWPLQYMGPRINKMAEVVLNLTKEAVSPETEVFR